MLSTASLLISLSFISSSLLAQSTLSPQQQIEKRGRERKDVLLYCRDVDGFAKSHRPRLFAQITDTDWQEFADKAKWEDAGKPVPVALVWTRAEQVIAVRLAFNVKAKHVGIANYYFRPDGSTARIKTVADFDERSDFRDLSSELLFGVDWIYLPEGSTMRKSISDDDPRPLKSERTVVLQITPPEYRFIAELPFANRLHKDMQVHNER